MSMRFTEEEAIRLGFKQDSKGDWHSPSIGKSAKAGIKKAEERVAQDIRVRGQGIVSDDQRNSVDASKGDKSFKEKGKRTRKASLVGENGTGVRYRIRVTSYRRSDADSDGLVPKWYIDALVNVAKVIPDDGSKYVDCTSMWVIPVATEEEERTLIEVFEYDS